MNPKDKIQHVLDKLKNLQPIDESIVHTLYTLSEKSLITAIVFTIMITIFLYAELSYAIVLWACLLIVFLLFRLYKAYLFKKSPQMYSVEIWHKKFMISAFLTGLIVSSLGFIFVPYLDSYYQLFVLASLLGLTGGATTSLASDFRIAIVYISIIMLPLIGSLFMIQSSTAFMLAILMILFFISQIGMIFNNYTEQKAVKELKVQQNLLNHIFSESPLAMLSYDNSLNISYANKHLNKLFGQENNMIGINLNSLHNTDILNVFKDVLTKGPQSYTGSFSAQNGNHLWLQITGFSFKGLDNTILGGVGIIENKTQEYKDRNALENLHRELKEQIKDNQFLLDENKQFIADMVHQIRTPLAVIMTNTSLIEMKSEESIASYLVQIDSAINMLSNSYEDLSYIISNDTIEYRSLEIDLTNFLSERIDFFKYHCDCQQQNHLFGYRKWDTNNDE